jgi:lipid-A-disaccharide synthase
LECGGHATAFPSAAIPRENYGNAANKPRGRWCQRRHGRGAQFQEKSGGMAAALQGMTKLAVVAGEASGDLHASEVIRELKKLRPDLTMFGIGGDLLAAEGMEILHHARGMAIVGLFNVIRHLGMFRRVFKELVARIERDRPDAVLLVDYPDFNLRLAKKCRQLGLRVIYYISPQLWAWRQGRVKEIARNVDEMIVIFPFEETFYRQHGVSVTYVGHPLIEQLAGVPTRSGKPGDPVRIALLPGSRRMEVAALLPPMIDAVRLLRKDRRIEAFVIQAPTIGREEIDSIFRAAGETAIAVVDGDRRRALAGADIALSSSGTATLESAILNVPVVVMYRLSPATHWLARKLVRLPHFSLVNIVAGKEVVPELLQDQVRGEAIAIAARRLLEPDRYSATKGELALVRAKLGEPGASRRAAEKIATLV